MLRSNARGGDLVSRPGGEEFAIVCLDADDEGVRQLAGRVHSAIEQLAVPLPGAPEPLRCTATVGISRPFHGPDGLDAAMQEADAALYRGKAAGRSRIEWAQ